MFSVIDFHSCLHSTSRHIEKEETRLMDSEVFWLVGLNPLLFSKHSYFLTESDKLIY